MPHTLSPVPAHLTEGAFLRADARTLGLTPKALRHARFRQPFRGVYRLDADPAPPTTLHDLVRQAAQDFLPLLRQSNAALSHTTALILLGCPIRCAPELHVTVAQQGQRPRRAGLIGHTISGAFEAWIDGHGLRIMPPALALQQSAALLPFPELVVAADHLVHVAQDGRGRRVAALAQLWDTAGTYTGRGAVRLRAALRFTRVGAESRMETLTRLLMARYGLDDLELQVDLHDEAGRWIGRFDMVDRRRRLIIEYDGEQHRTDRAQYLKDQQRLDRARAAGYRVLRLHREDVLDHPHETARRIAEFLGRPLRPLRPALARYFDER